MPREEIIRHMPWYTRHDTNISCLKLINYRMQHRSQHRTQVGCGAIAGCWPRPCCGPELVVEPELVVRLCMHGVRAAWLCMGPGLVLRVGLVVYGNRAGSAREQSWLCMGTGLVGGG